MDETPQDDVSPTGVVYTDEYLARRPNAAVARGVGAAAMVLGWTVVCAVPLGILGLVLSLRARRADLDEGRSTTMATQGIVFSVAGLVLAAAMALILLTA